MTRLPSFPVPPSPDARPGDIHQVSRRAGRLLVAVAAVALVACDDPYALEAVRVVGALELGKQVQIPDTMTAGEPSEISFWTNGDGCVTGGETEVNVTGQSALVIPYDYLGSEGSSCGILLFQYFEHKADVVFHDPGTAEITIAYSSDGWYLRRYGYKVYTVEVTQ